MTQRIGFLVLGCALLACGGTDESESEPVIRPVRYVVVSTGDGARERSFSGVVRAGSQTRISFQVPGRISELPVSVGDRVTRGQQLAAVDPTDFELQLQEARASAAQARAQAQSAAATYERIRALYANRNASRQDLDNARAQRDSAQSASAAVGQSVRRLQRQLQYATLTAPGDGAISEVMAEPNEVVAAGQVIAVLQVGDQLEVAVDVPETHINRVERGDDVQVSIDAHEGAIAGTVYEVGVPTQGSAAFPVTVRLPSDLTDVRAGMAADVAFAFEVTEEVGGHVLPVTAVGEDRQGRFVWVVEGEGETGTVHRAGVEIGDIGAEGIEIREGLEDGQRVVTAGVSRITEGLEVRVPPLDAQHEDDDARDDAPQGEAEGGDEG